MLRSLPLLVFIATFFTGCIPTYIPQVSLNETHQNYDEVVMHKILIVGAGSTASRLFLDNLSTKLMGHLKEKGIQSEFDYVGKIPRGAKTKLEMFVKPSFDGYIIFNSEDTSYYSTHKEKAVFALPAGSGSVMSGRVYGNQYVENFIVEAYTMKENLNMVWQSKLNLDLDATSQDRCSNISKMILSHLAKNHVVFK